jgi:molybdopterin-guanine dinucleotide biosynthesis protein
MRSAVNSDPGTPVPVLIVTGPVGVGKTSVTGEIFSQLTERAHWLGTVPEQRP